MEKNPQEKKEEEEGWRISKPKYFQKMVPPAIELLRLNSKDFLPSPSVQGKGRDQWM